MSILPAQVWKRFAVSIGSVELNAVEKKFQKCSVFESGCEIAVLRIVQKQIAFVTDEIEIFTYTTAYLCILALFIGSSLI